MHLFAIHNTAAFAEAVPQVSRRILFVFLVLSLLTLSTTQQIWAAPGQQSPTVLLQLRGGELLQVDQIQLQPQRDAQRSIQYTAQSHLNSVWYFLEGGAFVFAPADGGGPAQGQWALDEQTGVITFAARRVIDFGSTGSNVFAMQGVITRLQDGRIVAQVAEEASAINAARINGQSFGSNSSKYIEFWLQLN
jgi:hypothetical protein